MRTASEDDSRRFRQGHRPCQVDQLRERTVKRRWVRWWIPHIEWLASGRMRLNTIVPIVHNVDATRSSDCDIGGIAELAGLAPALVSPHSQHPSRRGQLLDAIVVIVRH